jgi:hypothetical protein
MNLIKNKKKLDKLWDILEKEEDEPYKKWKKVLRWLKENCEWKSENIEKGER